MRKQIILILLILLMLLSNNKEIKQEQIFLQKENNYAVLVYLDTCLACRNTKMFLNEMEKRENKIIYYLDFNECKFVTNHENNLNINNYKDIYIELVPTLLLIENKVIVNELVGYKDIVKNY